MSIHYNNQPIKNGFVFVVFPKSAEKPVPAPYLACRNWDIGCFAKRDIYDPDRLTAVSIEDYESAAFEE